MGGMTPKLKTPIQGNALSQKYNEFKEIGSKEFSKKYTPKIKETRKQETLSKRKKKSENIGSETNKRTLLGG